MIDQDGRDLDNEDEGRLHLRTLRLINCIGKGMYLPNNYDDEAETYVAIEYHLLCLMIQDYLKMSYIYSTGSVLDYSGTIY